MSEVDAFWHSHLPWDHGGTDNWTSRTLVEFSRIVIELTERPQRRIIMINQLFEGRVQDRRRSGR